MSGSALRVRVFVKLDELGLQTAHLILDSEGRMVVLTKALLRIEPT